MMGTIVVMYFVGVKLKLMIGYDEPVMNSLTNEFDVNDDKKHALTSRDMSIPLVVLMEGSGNTEDEIMKQLPLDRDSRQYIHVTVLNIIKTYDKQENESVAVEKYPLEKCSRKMMETPYELEFYNSRMVGSHYYCAQDDKIYMQGTRENAVYKRPHSYMIYEVRRGKTSHLMAGDPPCKDEDAIDRWTESK